MLDDIEAVIQGVFALPPPAPPAEPLPTAIEVIAADATRITMSRHASLSNRLSPRILWHNALRTTFENSNGHSAGTWATSFASLLSTASVQAVAWLLRSQPVTTELSTTHQSRPSSMAARTSNPATGAALLAARQRAIKARRT